MSARSQVTTSSRGSFGVGSEGSGGCGARHRGQAVGLPVVGPVRGCGGSPVQGGAEGAVACDAVGALDRGGQPGTLRAAPTRPRAGSGRRMLGAGDREEISRGIAEGHPGVVIAARIGRDPSVVSREIARHGGRGRYRAVAAGRAAAASRGRPKVRKLDASPVLRERVLGRLRAGCSQDTMVFNGSGGAEKFAATANGPRLRFTRDVGNIVMDTDDVERVALSALGGADTVTVGDLSGTDVRRVDIDLGAQLGGTGGDGAVDAVTVQGTAGRDVVRVSGSDGDVRIQGLKAKVTISNAEPADQLTVDTLAGNDDVDAGRLTPGTITFSVL